jgi:hypothetical protein
MQLCTKYANVYLWNNQWICFWHTHVSILIKLFMLGNRNDYTLTSVGFTLSKWVLVVMVNLTCGIKLKRVAFKSKIMLDILYAYFAWNWQFAYECELKFEIWYQGMILGYIKKSNSLYVFSDSFHSVQNSTNYH